MLGLTLQFIEAWSNHLHSYSELDEKIFEGALWLLTEVKYPNPSFFHCNSKIAVIPKVKLYIPSTLNVDLILWQTILIVCAENVKSWFKLGVFLLLFSISCPIPWIVCVSAYVFKISYLTFRAVLVLPKTAGSAQTHKSMSFIWIVWSTLYVYFWLEFEIDLPFEIFWYEIKEKSNISCLDYLFLQVFLTLLYGF